MRGLALDLGVLAGVDDPGQHERRHREHGQDGKRHLEALLEQDRNDERAVGCNRGREARDLRSLLLVGEDVGHHAERGAVDEAGGEEQHHHGAEEHREVVTLDAHDKHEGRGEHDDERDKRHLGTGVDLVGQPAADGTDARADERPEKRDVERGHLGKRRLDDEHERRGVPDERAKPQV